MGCGVFSFYILGNSDKTIFWYEESNPLRFATDNFWIMFPVQLAGDLVFALSFIFNDFYSCSGFFGFLVSAFFSNLWLLSASQYDISVPKKVLAGMNFLRTLTYLLFNDFECEYQPDITAVEFGSFKKMIFKFQGLVSIVSRILNIVVAVIYFLIDDYLSSKMAWVLAACSISHSLGIGLDLI